MKHNDPLIYALLGVCMLMSACTKKKEQNPLMAQNKAPVLEIKGFSKDTLSYHATAVYPFEFTVTDENDDELQVTVTCEDTLGVCTFIEKYNSGLYQYRYSPFMVGAHTIQIHVTDNIETLTQALYVYFSPNIKPVPVIEWKAIKRDDHIKQFKYHFDGSRSTDVDGKIVKYNWYLNGKNEEAVALDYVFYEYDNYQIELTVYDDHGAFARDSVVIDNRMAKARLDVPLETTNAYPLVLDGSHSFAPTGITGYYFYLVPLEPELPVLLNTDTKKNKLILSEPKPVGKYCFGLVVKDAYTTSKMEYMDVRYQNTPPHADFELSASYQTIQVDTNNSSDIDPEDRLYYYWYQDGRPICTSSDRDEAITFYGPVPKIYTITLKAVDQSAAFHEKSLRIFVPGDPQPSFVFGNGKKVVTHVLGDTVRLDATASWDGDHESGVVYYKWMVYCRETMQMTYIDSDSLPFYEFIATAAIFPQAHETSPYLVALSVKNGAHCISAEADTGIIYIREHP